MIFRLLVDAFDDYAEGYNYLGLIAYQRSGLPEAFDHFRKTTADSGQADRPFRPMLITRSGKARSPPEIPGACSS